jgi:hypothetical protein
MRDARSGVEWIRLLEPTIVMTISKTLDNHMAAIALHFMHYNLGRPHKTLANPYPRTPAMAVGKADHIWSLTEIEGQLDSN